VPILSSKFRVTLFDLLGFGFSDKPDNYLYSFNEYVKILNLLTLYLKIKETHIIAHDLGVSIAQEILAKNKKEDILFSIKSICFTNGNLFYDVYKPRIIQRLLSQTPSYIGEFLSKNIPQKVVFKSIRQLYGNKTQPNEYFLEELWEILNFKRGKEISYLLGKLIFEKAFHQKRWTEAMKKTAIPMCYICGPADKNTGIDMAIAFQKRIPKGKLIWMDDHIGHWPMIEDSLSFADNYLNWIDSMKSN
jgi:pimeloyl-ACP methyl ester carboxylesterase